MNEIMTISLDKNKDWLDNVPRVLSPNCDARPATADIDMVVMHCISLPPREYGGPYVDQLFTNTLDTNAHPYFAEISDLKVSAHLFINRQGNIKQYVPFRMRAWHAGDSSFQDKQCCNDFSIGIELEGCDEEAYETDQYHVAADIIKVLISHWPDINKDRIVGHSDIAPGRKTDPGPAFDWTYFRSLI